MRSSAFHLFPIKSCGANMQSSDFSWLPNGKNHRAHYEQATVGFSLGSTTGKTSRMAKSAIIDFQPGKTLPHGADVGSSDSPWLPNQKKSSARWKRAIIDYPQNPTGKKPPALIERAIISFPRLSTGKKTSRTAQTCDYRLPLVLHWIKPLARRERTFINFSTGSGTRTKPF